MTNTVCALWNGCLKSIQHCCLCLCTFCLFAGAVNAQADTLRKKADTTSIKGDSAVSVKDSATPAGIKDTAVITGKITDFSGKALENVTIMVKNAGRIATSAADGSYKITVPNPAGAILVFSLTGYPTTEQPVAGKATVNVSMKQDVANVLPEVVAIGYGSVKKSDLTGAVTRVGADAVKNQTGLVDPLQGLQGKVAGADIIIGNKPGDAGTVNIRGLNSITGPNTPLIVLDGAPYSGALSDINVHDIASFDVLKDASASAIYGSRGSNGVIIITTKRGVKGDRFSVSFDGYVGISKVLKRLDMMDGPTYAKYKRAAYPGRTDQEIFDPIALNAIRNNQYTDWQDVMFSGSGIQTDNNVSVDISGEKSSHKISLGYTNIGSILKNMSFERYTARFNGDVRLSDKFSIAYTAMYNHSIRDLGDNNTFKYGNVLDPLTKAYDDNGNPLFYPNGWYATVLHSNPLFDLEDINLERKNFRDRIFINVNLNWEILQGLSFKSSVTPDLQFIEQGEYWGPQSQDRQGAPRRAAYSKEDQKSITFTNQLNYKNEFGDHRLDVSAVQDAQTFSRTYLQLTGVDMPYYGKWYNVNEAPTDFSRASDYYRWRLLSYMGRVNYAFKDRYLLTLTGRYDGSSRLSRSNQWGFFPSAAFAWRIIQEPFMKNQKLFSDLKLRISWGNTGNTATSPYQTLGELGRYQYIFGDDASAIGYLPTSIPNPDLKWERLEEYNVGFDFGFLNGRINGEVNFYERNTHDLIFFRLLPYTSGYEGTLQNIGKTRNKGIEVSLNTTPVRSKDFEWNLNLTFAKNKNEIIDIYGNKQDDPGNKWFIGQPINVDWLYQYDGVWQEKDRAEAEKYGREPGNPKVKDINGNGTYDQGDLMILNRVPKWTGGLSSTIRYKNFDFNFYMYTRQGYGEVLGLLTDEAGSTRYGHLNVNFWTPENQSNSFPKPQVTNPQDLLVSSTYAFRDLSFIRLKTLNLGYRFSNKLSERVGLKSLRAYVTVDNPFLWTMNKLEVLDPENSRSYPEHPPMTTFIFGVNVQF
ncbi:SusC/RagA family TonB-linked outer membrane protein [Foetidibacter luteolus]|uniref:SusC/RagA family TonB-linked outer membrane protein n=1 Tax=Foetidibacter luteolus TaxID=2608880 RepID=UPI00129AFA45|nr:TonB-dependent receptor [Foetidibacter luteolus]